MLLSSQVLPFASAKSFLSSPDILMNVLVLAQLAELRSLAGELTLSCARPAVDG